MARLLASLVLVAASFAALPARAQLPAAGCDFSGDGRADLAVGIPGAGVGAAIQAGHVTILPGGAGGVGFTPIEGIDEDAPGVNGIAEQGDHYGAVVVCGDFNGDGDADVAIAAFDENRFQKRDTGQVSVLYGNGNGVRTNDDRVVTQQTKDVPGVANKYDRFGKSLAVGDFDGNGIDDLAVGVPLEDVAGQVNAGAVHVFYGFPGGLGFSVKNQFWHENYATMIGEPGKSDFFGAALAAGDFDGDGRDDLAIGIPGQSVAGSSDAGQVSVLYGRFGGLNASFNEVWNLGSAGMVGAPDVGDEFGASLATGDFDGDGFDDLAIGAPGKDVGALEHAGQVFTIGGSAGGLTAVGSQQWHQDAGLDDAADAYDRFGAAVAAGDFDGDGFDDLVVGVPNEWSGASEQEGAIHVILGSAGGLTTAGDEFWQADAVGLPSTAGTRLGTTLTTGDFDGDGLVDVAAGAPTARVGGETSAGAVYVFDGSTTSGLSSSGQQYVTRNSLVGSSGDPFERFGAGLAAS